MDGERGTEVMQSRDVSIIRCRDSDHPAQATEPVPKITSFDPAPTIEAEQQRVAGVLALSMYVLAKLA